MPLLVKAPTLPSNTHPASPALLFGGSPSRSQLKLGPSLSGSVAARITCCFSGSQRCPSCLPNPPSAMGSQGAKTLPSPRPARHGPCICSEVGNLCSGRPWWAARCTEALKCPATAGQQRAGWIHPDSGVMDVVDLQLLSPCGGCPGQGDGLEEKNCSNPSAPLFPPLLLWLLVSAVNVGHSSQARGAQTHQRWPHVS